MIFSLSLPSLSFLSLCDEVIVVAFELYILLTQDLTQEGNCPFSQYLFVTCYYCHMLFFPVFCFGIPDLALGILEMLIGVCFGDVLQLELYQFVPGMI